MNFLKLNNGTLLNLDKVSLVDKENSKVFFDNGFYGIAITKEEYLKIDNYLFRKQIFNQERRCDEMKKLI